MEFGFSKFTKDKFLHRCFSRRLLKEQPWQLQIKLPWFLWFNRTDSHQEPLLMSLWWSYSVVHHGFPCVYRGLFAEVMRCSVPSMLRKTLLTSFTSSIPLSLVVNLNLHKFMPTYNLIKELSNDGGFFIFNGFCLSTIY